MADISNQEKLRIFVRERLEALDPTIDLATNSPADIQVVQPLVRRFAVDPLAIDTELFIKTRVIQEFGISVGDGDAIADLLVKPMRALLEPFIQEIIFLRNNQSLADPATLASPEADALVSNVFVDRSFGAKAVGIGRVLFASPTTVSFTLGNVFSTSTGLQFFPSRDQYISLDQMIFNQTPEGLFFIDVALIAEVEGDGYNIGIGILNGVSNLATAVRVTNLAPFAQGGDTESTTELVARARNSLSERTLTTRRGIIATLSDAFGSAITQLTNIGHSDIEMQRDIIRASGLAAGAPLLLSNIPGGLVFPNQTIPNDVIHVGGLTDIYLRGPTTIESTAFPVDAVTSDRMELRLDDGVTANITFNSDGTDILESLHGGFLTPDDPPDPPLPADPIPSPRRLRKGDKIRLLGTSGAEGVYNVIAPISDARVRVDAAVPIASGVPGRILRDLTMLLNEPADRRTPVFSTGVTVIGANLFTTSTLLNFEEAEVQVGDVLRIQTGELDAGDFTVTGISDGAGTKDTLEVSQVFGFTSVNISFEVLNIKTAMTFPIVRTQTVDRLVGGSASGEIPLGTHVAARSTRFFNEGIGTRIVIDDGVVTDQGLGTGVLISTVVGGLDRAGVRPGDRLNILEDDGTHTGEYREIGGLLGDVGDPTYGQKMFLAPGQEPLTAASGYRLSVGAPSIGVARVYFKEPVTVEVSGETLETLGSALGVFPTNVDPIWSTLSELLSTTRFTAVEGGVTKTYIPDPQNRFQLFPRPDRTYADPGPWCDITTTPSGGGSYVRAYARGPFAQESEARAGDVMIIGERKGYLGTIDLSGTVNATTPFPDLSGTGSGSSLRLRLTKDEESTAVETLFDGSEASIGDVIAKINTAMGKTVAHLYADRRDADPSTGFVGLTNTTGGSVTGVQLSGTVTVGTLGAFDPTSVDLTDLYIVVSNAGTNDGVYQVSTSGQTATSFEVVGSFVDLGPLPDAGVDIQFISTVRLLLLAQEILYLYDSVGGGQVGAASDLGLPVSDSSSEAGPDEVITATVTAVTAQVDNERQLIYQVIPDSRNSAMRSLTAAELINPAGLGYRIERVGQRFLADDVEANPEFGLYYADVQLVSEGSGNIFNLEADVDFSITGLVAEGYSFESEDDNLTYSPAERLRMRLPLRFTGLGDPDDGQTFVELYEVGVQLNNEIADLVDQIQTFTESPDDRVVTEGILVRHLLPAYVLISFTYSGGSGTQVMENDMADIIHGTDPGERLELSDLEAVLTRRGASFIEQPAALVALVHGLDRQIQAQISPNFIGSARVETFLAEAITLTRTV